MPRTLIVGLGRAGAGLHLPVLRKLRATWPSQLPFVAVDPQAHTVSPGSDVRVVASLATAAGLVDPVRTVVHVCTPPGERPELLRELAELGFRDIIVEKPVTTDRAALAAILNLADARGLRLAVVAPWLASKLTARLTELVTAGELGALRAIEIHQSKPRLRRSLATAGHPTAFDVEPPHSLGVCLQLAGAARLIDARLSDMVIGTTVIPNMGSAELVLHHATATSRIVSDLASPVRERRIELDFDRGHVIGHYPGSEDDHYAHLHVAVEGRPSTREVFPDDALTEYMADTYLGFQQGRDFRPELAIACQVVELLADAKDLCLTGTEAASVG
ncbi:Gfo/Idh/MocA family oxidoreductase [Actinophytocola sediminis]